MQNARFVGGLRSIAGLPDKIADLCQLEPPSPFDEARQGLPHEQLHHHIRLARVEHPFVVRLDDVCVANVTIRGHFAPESVDPLRRRPLVRVQQLEGTALLQSLVLDLVDSPHSPCAQRPHDPEFAVEQRPCREDRGILHEERIPCSLRSLCR